LQIRTQERDEAFQTTQVLKGDLEVSQLKGSELNKQITQLQNELAEVHKKLEEVKRDRDNNHHVILNHHQGKIKELEKERNELLRKHQTLTTLYEENSQQLTRLKRKFKNEEAFNKVLETKFLNACLKIDLLTEKLKEGREKNYKLEQEIEKMVNEFEIKIFSLKTTSTKEKL